jgi:site-specific recombinase XerD
VLYATGLRRAELLALDLADVERDTRELVVRRGKGG